MRHPVLRGLMQSVHVAVLSRQPHLAQRRRIPGTQTWIATDPAFAASAGQACLGALTDQRALELGGRPQNLECKLALRAGRVDRILKRAKERAPWPPAAR